MEPEDDLSDDEKEFFGISKKKGKHIKVSQSARGLPGLDTVINNNGKQIKKAGTNYNKFKRDSNPKRYAKRNNNKGLPKLQASDPVDHNRAATAAIPNYGQITNNMNFPPPPPPSSAPQSQQPPPPPFPATLSHTTSGRHRRLSDPPPVSSAVVEATQERLSIARRRSFGGSISGKSALNNNEMMKHVEYVQDESEYYESEAYDDVYDGSDALMGLKQVKDKSTPKPSSSMNVNENVNLNHNNKKKNKFGALTKLSKQSSAPSNNGIAMSTQPSYGCVIWRNCNVHDDDNKLMFRQIKNILTDVQQFANNQSVLQAVNERMQITEDILVVVNSQNESKDHELIGMLRQNLSFDQELVLYNNKQNGKYRAPWLTEFSNIKFTQSQDEVLKHIKKFTKYAKLNALMKSDEDTDDEPITKSNHSQVLRIIAIRIEIKSKSKQQQQQQQQQTTAKSKQIKIKIKIKIVMG